MLRKSLLVLCLIYSFHGQADEEAQVLDPGNVSEAIEETLDGASQKCDPKTLGREEAHLKNVLTCALDAAHPPSPPSPKRIRSINFLLDRLQHNFDYYGITSETEKAHFLAQVLAETDGLSALIERRYNTSSWRTALDDPSTEQWNCNAYQTAIESDDNFYDNVSSHSRNDYRAAFRGRGLLRLTGCSNYLGFFYHKAAISANRPDLADKHKTYWSYTEERTESNPRPRRKKLGSFCSREELLQAKRMFNEDGLSFNEDEFVNNFQATINRLSTPCEENTASSMNAKEFLVDSSFWYWRKCRGAFAEWTNSNTPQSVALFSQCINGNDYFVSNYARLSCPDDLTVVSTGNFPWETNPNHLSWCKRNIYFNELKNCFSNASVPVSVQDPNHVGEQ